MSNIATLTRLGLFCETMRLFLRALRWEHPELRPVVPEGLLGRYLKEEDEATHYEDAHTGEGRRRLSVCARDREGHIRDCQGAGCGATCGCPCHFGELRRTDLKTCSCSGFWYKRTCRHIIAYREAVALVQAQDAVNMAWDTGGGENVAVRASQKDI